MTCQPPITISEQVGFVQRYFLDASVNAPVNLMSVHTDQVSDYVGGQVESFACRVRHIVEWRLKTSIFHFGNNCDVYCGG